MINLFIKTAYAQGPLGGANSRKEELNTAIGCIPIENKASLISFLLRWGIGIAGGIAVIFILYSAFLLITSSGDPKKVQAGQELLTAAIAGLVFLIMSVFILRVIGIDILGITQIAGI